MNTANESQIPNTRLHFLDGLRCFASMIILFHHSFTKFIMKILDGYHLNFLNHYFSSFMQSGVELFFTLSGIVLLRPYLMNNKKFKVIDYYKRRFKRIYPTYFFAALFAILVCFILSIKPNWYTSIVTKFSWSLVPQQFIIFQSWNYFNPAWWSLKIEIFFYLLCPLVIFFFLKVKTKMNIIVELLLLIIISVAVQVGANYFFPTHYQYNNETYKTVEIINYIPCFYLGTRIAQKNFDVSFSKYCFIIGLVLFIGSKYYLPAVNMGFGFLYAGVITYIFNSQNLQQKLSKYIFIWLGERSYSIFLVHFSAFYLVNYTVSLFLGERSMFYGILTRCIGIPFAIFVAMLLFYFVEKKYARGLRTDTDFFLDFKNKSI